MDLRFDIMDWRFHAFPNSMRSRMWAALIRGVTGAAALALLACGGGEEATDPVSPEDEVGPPRALRFTVEPGGASGGTPFTRQPVVEIVDRRGNRVVTADLTVTVALAEGSGEGVLTGTTSVPAEDGIARFTDLSIDRAATGYVVVATAPGLAEATSQDFEVAIGPAATLAFAEEPGGAVAARPFVFQPAVEILDAGGNRVVSSTATVELEIEENPAEGTLSGTPTVEAVEGLAEFGNLRIDKAGEGYSLKASAGALEPALSQPFNVALGPPRDLAFVTQPAGASGGTPFETQPQVEVLDGGGNRVTSATMAVTIAIQANPARGTLSGTTTVEAVAGLVSFTDLAIDRAGSGYSLIASAEGLRNARSEEFDVVVGPPSQLALLTQPDDASGGTPFGQQPVVEVTDAGGNRVTDLDRDVTVSIDVNPAGGTLSGTATVTSVDGVASFTDLRIDRAGDGYRLDFGSGDLARAVSDPFDVIVGPPAGLNFLVEPGAGMEGKPFQTQPSIEVLDAGGNRVTTATANVTLVIGSNPAEGALSGTTRRAPVDGVATFDDLRIDRAGHAYTLVATSGTLPGRESAGFDVRITYAAVSAGTEHTCGLSVTGTAYCWGANADGQLGDATTADRPVPTPVAGDVLFQSLSAGSAHTCGVTSARSAQCWGRGTEGQLGDGLNTSASTPVQASGGLSFLSVSAGGAHTCSVTTGFVAYCWGANGSGQVGDGTFVKRAQPTAVTRSNGATRVGVGASHSCGLLPQPGSGVVDGFCWGENSNGQLGDGTATTSSVPVSVSGQPGFDFLAVGQGHGCGIDGSAVLSCWGANDFGQLGDGSLAGKDVPTPVAGGLSFQRVAAGAAHTCGVATDDQGYCWGRNADGQLGDGSAADSPVPVGIAGGLDLQRIAAGGQHSCALTTDGRIFCWGDNGRGQLGDGSAAASAVPVRTAAPWE